jgi:hypothetical protein
MTDQATTTPKFDAAKLLELWNGTIEKLTAFKPDYDEFLRWRERRHTLTAELRAMQAEVDEKRNIVSQHEYVVADLKRQQATLQEQNAVASNDLARIRREVDATQKRLDDIKRRNP